IGRSGRAHGTLRHRASLSRARVEKQREPTKPSSKWRGPDLVAGPAKKLRDRARLALEPETGDLEANPPALHPTDRPQAIGPNPATLHHSSARPRGAGPASERAINSSHLPRLSKPPTQTIKIGVVECEAWPAPPRNHGSHDSADIHSASTLTSISQPPQRRGDPTAATQHFSRRSLCPRREARDARER